MNSAVRILYPFISTVGNGYVGF